MIGAFALIRRGLSAKLNVVGFWIISYYYK